MRRYFFGLAFAAIAAMTPVCGMANDQQIAEYVKNRLAAEQRAGNLRGYNVDMRVEGGTIWLSGTVASESHEKLILETAQGAAYLGAKQVVDDIEVAAMGRVTQATGSSAITPRLAQAGYQEAAPETLRQMPPVPMNQAMQPTYAMPQQAGYPAQQVAAPMPMPMGYGGGSPAANSGQPNLPGYAWPAYAANPNVAAVNYPQQYSASAWPYIGPFYPYPQVPMGWRKVSMEWDDGWWYLDFHDR